jgi:hypothetical protein
MSAERLVMMFYGGSPHSLRLVRTINALHDQTIDL